MSDPTLREWLDHAHHGLQSLSDLYHGGGADGKGITVKEFRHGIDFVWEQIHEAIAALPAPIPCSDCTCCDTDKVFGVCGGCSVSEFCGTCLRALPAAPESLPDRIEPTGELPSERAFAHGWNQALDRVRAIRASRHSPACPENHAPGIACPVAT